MERWYVLYTKPHKEQQIKGYLEGKGYETYLPSVRVRGKEREEPFFSCYLFVRMDVCTDYWRVCWVPGLRRVVSFGGQPAVVDDELIGMLRQRLAGWGEGCGVDWMEPGDRVVMVSGPLRGIEGVFEGGLSSGERARVLVEILGRGARCEVGIERLKRVG